MRLRLRLPAVLLCVGCLVPAAGGAPARAAVPETDPRALEAEALYGTALARLRDESIESRRMAIAELERATLLQPEEPRYQLALARAYYKAGFLSYARKRYEKVGRLSPGDFDSHMGMGLVWRRDWLKYLDEGSLELAIGHFQSAGRARPSNADPWLQLVPLRVERGELDSAFACAERALAAAPERAEARLATAYVSFRLGQIARAATDFERAIPGLPRLARERFDDISPVSSEEDTMTLHRLPLTEQPRFIDRFWREHDPDFTTPENEARLEYWSRVAQAYFLYFNTKREEWDLRGEVYVRYGPPERAEYNPLGERLSVSFGAYGNYPANVLVWDYPSLGMRVALQDRLLSEHYLLPITLTHDPDPRPDPGRIGEDLGQLPTRGGRGVFPMLPPGTRELPFESVLARFEGASAPRLLAQVESEGGPAQDLSATWVVVDTSLAEVLRGSRTLSPSACEPEAMRVADFAGSLEPGTYTVSLSIRDGARGRGVHRREIALGASPRGLALSDLVISCGPPITAGAGAVRPEPNPSARIPASDPVTGYFEIYNLAPGADGVSQFEYVYSVESAEKDPRVWIQRVLAPRQKPDPITVSRAETHAGTLRRQFLTVPLGALPAGRYRLLVRVRDMRTGAVAATEAEFERLDGERR